jgi:endonuclease YncB( thermonuclease family)
MNHEQPAAGRKPVPASECALADGKLQGKSVARADVDVQFASARAAAPPFRLWAALESIRCSPETKFPRAGKTHHAPSPRGTAGVRSSYPSAPFWRSSAERPLGAGCGLRSAPCAFQLMRSRLRFASARAYILEMDIRDWRKVIKEAERELEVRQLGDPGAKRPGASKSAARVLVSPGRAGTSWAFTAWHRAKWTFLALGLLFGHGTAVGGDIVSYAIVQDDATLRVQGKTIRLFGVYPVDLRRFCDGTFRPRRCQTRAAVALASKIQGFVHCDPEVRYHDGTIGAFCSVSGDGVLDTPADLGAYLIREGWAVALPEAPFEYHTLEKIARVNGRGVWGFQADSIIR